VSYRLPILAIVAVLLTLGSPTLALAHPLGNFSVNRYSRLEPAGDGVRVVYILDMAEIPTFQEQARLDADRDGQVTDGERARYAEAKADELRRNLHLTLDGASADLRLLDHALTLPPGQGGLSTLRLEATFAAPIPAGGRPITLGFRDENEPERLGWREIVARPGAADTRIEQTSVQANDRSDELRLYPDDLLSSPLDVREARITFVPGALGAEQGGRARPDIAGRGADAYAALVGAKALTPSVILVSLMTALVLGAIHALSPGHGKTVVAAYLVGSRGTAQHALFLGATVTATHTAGVYLLGLVTLLLSEYVLPERLYPVLELLSGLLVVGIGGWLFAGRLRGALAHRQAGRLALGWPGREPHDHHNHGHAHGHHHADGHEHGHDGDHGLVHSHGGSTHSHLPPGADGQPVTWRSLLALGVSGGLLPCPSALVVLLSAIALHRVGFGLALIVAFSLGLASVLVGIGLLLVYTGSLLQRFCFGGSLTARLLPAASALLILVAGLVITVQAIPRLM
jgi:nickel/cobalt exporter